jgi:hypothetical protein
MDVLAPMRVSEVFASAEVRSGGSPQVTSGNGDYRKQNYYVRSERRLRAEKLSLPSSSTLADKYFCGSRTACLRWTIRSAALTGINSVTIKPCRDGSANRPSNNPGHFGIAEPQNPSTPCVPDNSTSMDLALAAPSDATSQVSFSLPGAASWQYMMC